MYKFDYKTHVCLYLDFKTSFKDSFFVIFLIVLKKSCKLKPNYQLLIKHCLQIILITQLTYITCKFLKLNI